MKNKYRVHYSEEWYSFGEDGPKYRASHTVCVIEADTEENAANEFWAGVKAAAFLFDNVRNIKIEYIEEIYTPFFSETTKQNILKDFMKKC